MPSAKHQCRDPVVRSGRESGHRSHSKTDAVSVGSPEKRTPTTEASKAGSKQQDTDQPSLKYRLRGLWRSLKYRLRRLWKFLASPIAITWKFLTRLIVILGTLIGVLLGAGVLTIAWQGYDKDTELRATLVTDISTAFARTSMVSRSVASGSYLREEPRADARSARVQQKYNDGLRAWKEDAARIGAELHAYIEDPNVAKSWSRFEAIVTNYYQLSRSPPPPETPERARNLQSRSAWTSSIRDYVNDPSAGVAWDRIESREAGDEFYRDYTILGRLLLNKQSEISRGILDSSTVYQPTFESALSQVLSFIRG
jgi:hypothetical protein